MIGRGLGAGAVGVVSALASAFPELVVAAARDPDAATGLGALRERMQRLPFQSALKAIVAHRGVRVSTDVRRPLRTISDAERKELEAWLGSSSPARVP